MTVNLNGGTWYNYCQLLDAGSAGSKERKPYLLPASARTYQGKHDPTAKLGNMLSLFSFAFHKYFLCCFAGKLSANFPAATACGDPSLSSNGSSNFCSAPRLLVAENNKLLR